MLLWKLMNTENFFGTNSKGRFSYELIGRRGRDHMVVVL